MVDLTICGGRSWGTGRPAPAIGAANGLGGFPEERLLEPPEDRDWRCCGGGLANALACALATARPSLAITDSPYRSTRVLIHPVV